MEDPIKNLLKQTQSELLKQGINPGAVDGIMGPLTYNALLAYQKRGARPTKPATIKKPLDFTIPDSLKTIKPVKSIPSVHEMMATHGVPEWYARALKEMGVKEIPGGKSNPGILQYYKDVGHSEITDENTSWCAAFVGSMLERSGITSTKSLLAKSYLKWGRKMEAPRIGCIAILSRGDPTSWTGHIGFFVRQSKTAIYLLGGNQSNEVNETAFASDRVLAYRWPTEKEGYEQNI